MSAILTADSGSTKTHWIFSSEQGDILELKTSGINPVRDSQGVVLHVLNEELMPQIGHGEAVDHIYFYGAGCIAPFSKSVSEALAGLFPEADIHIDTDLMGAARALCGNEPGIVCILGTGANCGLYDGERITENVPPLGFILGDEGSGSVLGRTLVGNVFKGLLSPTLVEAFIRETGLQQADVLQRVYRESQPNVFLASLVPFITRHIDDAGIEEIVVETFRQFVRRNVVRYKPLHTHVNFVGGIAHAFRPQLQRALASEGMQLGTVLRDPATQIAVYHREFA